MMGTQRSVLYCDFCGKAQHEVFLLIAGPTVFICDECVALCVDIVRAEVVASRRKGGVEKIMDLAKYPLGAETNEALLVRLMEELFEAGLAAAKARRFGLHNFDPRNGLGNARALANELRDAELVANELRRRGFIPMPEQS